VASISPMQAQLTLSLRGALALWQSMRVLFGLCPFRLRRVKNPPHPNPLPLKGARAKNPNTPRLPSLPLPILPQKGGGNMRPSPLVERGGGEGKSMDMAYTRSGVPNASRSEDNV
jgi:hypothetical protein